MKLILNSILLAFLTLPLSAQSPYPFGTAPMSDMEMTSYPQDEDAVAVYLFDWGNAELVIGEDFKVNVERHFRIKILKQDGLDYASFKINAGDRPNFSKFKASTFNLEDGKMVESLLNKKEIFKEKTGNSYVLSFAFPNVKVGSVIECSYSILLGNVFELYPWSFQHSIPVAYSEFNAVFPAVFQYKIDGHYDNIKVNFNRTQKSMVIGSISTQELTYKWTSGNVPAFEPEIYMDSEAELLSRVEFELGGLDLPGRYEEITPTYEKLTQKLLDDENFGGIVNKSGFLEKQVQDITAGINDNIDKIKAIHKYITQNVKWNETMGIFSRNTSFKTILKNQSGSAADINLLFVAMLQKAGITSCPVILSTRENGSLNQYFAIISRFNYVVAYAKVDEKEYLMDATNEFRPFNELPPECLNGQGRTIHPRMSKWITLYNNEQEYDQVMINAELNKQNELVCNVQRIYGSYSAYNIRKMFQTLGYEGYIAFMKNRNGNNEYSDFVFQNQDSIGKYLIINYKVKIKGAVQTTPELSIINPVLFFARTENPFLASERKYPIAFDSPENEVYTLNILIPNQYAVDELPSELNLKLEKNGAIFNYSADIENDMISIKYRFVRKETHFAVDNYEAVKEFYNKFIKKQSDLVILKKKDAAIANNQ
jgi:transglutaminase-like putative cysteine protease